MIHHMGVGFDGEAKTEEMANQARLAENLGYHSVWASETRFMRDAFTTLSSFAQVTSKIKLATGIVNPYTRNPALIAVTAATLDRISGGRVILGVGAGSSLVLARQGIRQRRPLAAVSETVEVVGRLLSGQEVSYSGSFAELKDAKLEIPPVQSKIPIFIGATGPQMLELAGIIGDGVVLNSLTSSDYVKKAVGLIQNGVKISGRDQSHVEIAGCIECAISKDSTSSKDLIRRTIADYLTHFPAVAKESNFQQKLINRIRELVQRQDYDQAIPLVSDSMVDSLAVAGTEEECFEKLDGYIKLGVQLPIIFPHGTGAEIESTIRSSIKYLNENTKHGRSLGS